MDDANQLVAALKGAGHRQYSVDQVPDLIPDVPTFGDVCSSLTKEDALRKHIATVEALQEIVDANNTLTAKDADLHKGVARAEKERAALREERDARYIEECKQVLSEEGNWSEQASARAKRDNKLRFIDSAIEYGNAVLIPASRLLVLESDSVMASMYARLLTWKAIVAGIERRDAAVALQEVDGSVVFTVTGRAFNLLQESHQGHVLAARANEGLRTERERQKLAKEIKERYQ